MRIYSGVFDGYIHLKVTEQYFPGKIRVEYQKKKKKNFSVNVSNSINSCGGFNTELCVQSTHSPAETLRGAILVQNEQR